VPSSRLIGAGKPGGISSKPGTMPPLVLGALDAEGLVESSASPARRLLRLQIMAAMTTMAAATAGMATSRYLLLEPLDDVALFELPVFPSLSEL
jgi:hypothetical protein